MYTTFTVGQKVKFAEPMDESEEEIIMTVLELRGDRVLVSDDSLADWDVQPTSVYSSFELLPA